MMLMYFVSKHKEEWREVMEARKQVKPSLNGLCTRTLFEEKFLAFIKEAQESLKVYDKDDEMPLFVNDFTIVKLQEKYKLDYGQDANERFIDFEIYDDPNDPIRVTSVFELDEQNDIIKKAIRWKKKQLDWLFKSPRYETDEEREKKVKWKKQRKRSIMEWEDLIYDMTRSSRNIEDVYLEWKRAGHRVIEGSDEINCMLYGCECDGIILKDEISTKVEPLFPKGLTLNRNDGGAAGEFHFVHYYAIDVNVFGGYLIMIMSTFYFENYQISCKCLLYWFRLNPCRFGEVDYTARYHQKAPLGGAITSYINDGIFLGRNPSCPDGRYQFGGDEGSHAIEVAGLCLLDYPRRRDMHTT
jgi:hypothetical protein